MLWIAVLLAVLTSHLRALDDFMTQRYANRRAAPSFADLVLMPRRYHARMRRQSPQDSGHTIGVPGTKSEDEANFTVSDGSWEAVGHCKGGVGHEH